MRSNIIKKGNVKIEDMSVNQLIDFIKNNPSVLKRPIVVDDRRIQVGYNAEEIRSFVPAARRIARTNCPHEDNCAECKNAAFEFNKYLEEIKKN